MYVANPISRSFTPIRSCVCNLVLLNFLVLFFPVAFRACGVSSETECGILYVCSFVSAEWVGSFISYQRIVTLRSLLTFSIELGKSSRAPGSGVWSNPSIGRWGMISFLSLQMPAGIPVIHTQSCLGCISIWWAVGWKLGECFLLGAENGLYSLASCAAHGAWGLHRLSDREQQPALSCDLQAWWVLFACPRGTCGLFGSRSVEGRKGELVLAFRWYW